jgi:hypothetical protein
VLRIDVEQGGTLWDIRGSFTITAKAPPDASRRAAGRTGLTNGYGGGWQIPGESLDRDGGPSRG